MQKLICLQIRVLQPAAIDGLEKTAAQVLFV